MSEKRPAIPTATKLSLFAQAAGHCQYPECLEPLFPKDLGGEIHLAEMAHIIPWGEKGPRSQDRAIGTEDLHSVENLILLHPTCHKRIDKAPDQYPREEILRWKETHLASLNAKNGIIPYETREEAAKQLRERMEENKAIWDKFAPCDGTEFEYDPESETAKIWDRRVKAVIIPNHYHLLSVISLNRHHLSEKESKTVALYKEHVRGFTSKHLTACEEPAIRYPAEMEGLFK